MVHTAEAFPDTDHDLGVVQLGGSFGAGAPVDDAGTRRGDFVQRQALDSYWPGLVRCGCREHPGPHGGHFGYGP